MKPSSSSWSFEGLVRSLVREEMERAIEGALAEQRRMLAPFQPCGELLASRAALTVQETATALGVSQRQVRRWIGAGELVPLEFSGSRLLIGADQIVTKLATASGKRRNVGEAPS